VQPEHILRSLLTLGPYRYDETYVLMPSGAGCKLTAYVEVRTQVPALGVLLDRFYAGPTARHAFEASLAGLKRHCEAGGWPA
jgi:hypothetical protein